MLTIYHNPRCGKSRAALKILEESKQPFETVLYLKTGLTSASIHDLLQKLKLKPINLMRTKEEIWKKNYQDTPLSDQQIIEALIEYPILLERPIIIKDNKAIIARPPELTNELLN